MSETKLRAKNYRMIVEYVCPVGGEISTMADYWGEAIYASGIETFSEGAYFVVTRCPGCGKPHDLDTRAK